MFTRPLRRTKLVDSPKPTNSTSHNVKFVRKSPSKKVWYFIICSIGKHINDVSE